MWFNTVIRADFAPIIVREGANVQDGSVLHAPPGIPDRRRPWRHHRAQLRDPRRAHRAEAVIANHATVLDGAVIGARSLIAAHSLVVGGTKIPDEVLVAGAPAKVRGRSPGPGARDVGERQSRRLPGSGRRYQASFGAVPDA